MAYKMKGHSLPGIKQITSSSPLQAKDDEKQTKPSKKNRVRLLTKDEMKKRKINPKKDMEYYIDNKGGVSTSKTLKE